MAISRLAVCPIYSDDIGLRNSTQLGMVWIPAFAGMTTTRFFANHSVWSITSQKPARLLRRRLLAMTGQLTTDHHAPHPHLTLHSTPNRKLRPGIG